MRFCKSDDKSGSVVQKHDEDDERYRYSDQPEQYGHRFSPFFLGLTIDRSGRDVGFLFSPSPVAKAAAFSGGERRREGADEQ
jgi:hypothetical protein